MDTARTITLTGIRVGISALSYSASVTTMSFDDFPVRNLADPEPTTGLGAEQTAP